MTTTTTRRALLATAAAAPLLPLGAAGATAEFPQSGVAQIDQLEPAPAVASPVLLALLDEWHAACARVDDGDDADVTDAEIHRRMVPVHDLEERILTHPSETLADLACKLQVLASADWSLVWGLEAVADDARRILARHGVQHRWRTGWDMPAASGRATS